MEITLFSTNCPKCKMLEGLLKKKNIEYVVNTNVDEMIAMGFKSAPNLKVDDQIMDFATAWKWARARE